MAIRFVSIKCPECGATLDVEEGRQQLFCSYCGSKVIIQNDNEYIYRHIDEAEMKNAETEQMVRLKQLEMIEKKRASNEKVKDFKIRVSVALGVVALIAFGIGFAGAESLIVVGMVAMLIIGYMWLTNDDEKEENIELGDKVKVPSLPNYNKESYVSIEAKFKSAGFTNIECVPLNDLIIGLFAKKDTVESITINGHSITSGGKKFPSDASVIITYHSHQ